MKKLIISMLAFLAISFGLTACNTDSSEQNMNSPVPSASEMPNVDANGNYQRVPANNGVVTDTNGIIGDEDDLIPPPASNDKSAAERVGDTIGDAARNIGRTVSDVTSNAGNVVSNVTSNVGDTIRDIADNTGDTIENAADNARPGDEASR